MSLPGVNIRDKRASRGALFLDRDGTLIVHKPYLHTPADVEVLPFVRETLEAAAAAGYYLFLFTNQSGIGRGYFSLAQAEACNARLFELLGPRVRFSGVCIAPETPEQPAVYRKPSPRFIQEMISLHGLNPAQSWMVGDTAADIGAGLNAGVRAALIDSPETAVGQLTEGVWRCRDLADFYGRLSAL